MKNLPKEVYLQIGEDCDCDDYREIPTSDECTWSVNKIYDNDIRYVLDKRHIKKEK